MSNVEGQILIKKNIIVTNKPTTSEYLLNKREQHHSTSRDIISKIGTPLSDEEYLLISPTVKWPTSHAKKLTHCDIMKSTEHPYHRFAIHQYEDWEKNFKNNSTEFRDYYNKPLSKSIDRTKTYFTLETKGQHINFLAEVLTLAIEINRYLFNCSKLLSFLSFGSLSKFYQLWVNELLINRGWLFLHSLLQLSLIAYDLKQLKPKTTPPKIGSKHLNQIMEKRLASLYHCNGAMLAKYWHPVFLYILYKPNENAHIVPADFNVRQKMINNKIYEDFQESISDVGVINFTSKFGRYLGLLD